jgi:hypothetical protein
LLKKSAGKGFQKENGILRGNAMKKPGGVSLKSARAKKALWAERADSVGKRRTALAKRNAEARAELKAVESRKNYFFVKDGVPHIKKSTGLRRGEIIVPAPELIPEMEARERKKAELERELRSVSGKDHMLFARERRLREKVRVAEAKLDFNRFLAEHSVSSSAFRRKAESFAEELFDFFSSKKLRFSADDAFYLRHGQSYGFMRLANFLSKASIASSTKNLGGVYAYLLRRHGKPVFGSIDANFAMLFRANRIKRVLEVGCGTWGLAGMLAESGIAKKAGLQITAIDPVLKDNTKSSAEAVREMQNLGINVEATQFNDFIAEHPNARFDLILSNGVLSLGGLNHKTRSKFVSALIPPATNLANQMVERLSSNPNAAVVATSIRRTLALKLDAIARKAKIDYAGVVSERAFREDRGIFEGERERLLELSKGAGMSGRNKSSNVSGMNRLMLDQNYVKKVMGKADLIVIRKKRGKK